jgi:hypothetical protein
MKEKTKAYMAGMMDGDGCFSIFKTEREYSDYRPFVGFTNAYKPVCQWAVEHFGGTINQQKGFCHHNGYYSKELFHWRLYGRNSVRNFLSSIIPYLREKKEQAILLLEYINLDGKINPIKREELFLRLREMKKLGCVTTEMPNTPEYPKSIFAYMAGAIDSEGHITIGKDTRKNNTSYNVRVGLTNTFLPLLKSAQVIYGGGICSAGSKNPKPVSIWYISEKKSIERCILSILPYLIVKRERAKLMLDFVRMQKPYNPTLRASMYEQITGVKIQSEPTGNCGSVPVGTLAT